MSVSPKNPRSSRPPTSRSGKRSRTGRLGGRGEQRRGKRAEGAVAVGADRLGAVVGDVEARGQLAEGREPVARALEAAEVVPVAVRRVVVDGAVAVQPGEQGEVQAADRL